MIVGRKRHKKDKEVIKEIKLLGILANKSNITGNTFPIYKFAFIDKLKNENTFKLIDITTICEQLGIKKSSYYNWVSRGKPNHYNWDEKLAQKILKKQNTNRTLGARKISWLLEQDGIYIGPKKVIRYMKYLNILWDEKTARAKSQGRLKQERKFTGWQRTGLQNVFHYATRKISTKCLDKRIAKGKAKNYLCWIDCYLNKRWKVILRNNPERIIREHDFTDADKNNIKFQDALNSYKTALENKVLPNEIYGSDIMFLTRANRKEVLLLFVIIDIATRKVVDYCFAIDNDNNMTKYLKLIEKNIKGKHLIIWHSDNGDEYTDEKTKILFNKYKVQQSFTDKESSFQNGTVEGFFSQLSRHIYLRKLLDSNTTNDKIKKLATEFIALYNKRIEDTQKKNNFKYVYDKEINKRHRWYVQNFLNFSF